MTRPIRALSILMLAMAFMVTGPTAHAAEAQHRAAFHVDEADAARMNLVLNNAENLKSYYDAKGETVQIEIVTYGPGLNMLLEGKSPVKDRVAQMSLADPNLTFAACGNTHSKMSKKAGKELKLLPEARMVDSGVVRLMELQEAGWSYIRP